MNYLTITTTFTECPVYEHIPVTSTSGHNVVRSQYKLLDNCGYYLDYEYDRLLVKVKLELSLTNEMKMIVNS